VGLESFQARQEAVRAVLAEHELDALLVTAAPNIRYLSGFSGSAGMLLVTRDDAVLVTDFRYASQAPQEVGDAARTLIERTSVWDRMGRELAAISAARLGVESVNLTLRDARRLAEQGRFSIEPVEDVVEDLRASKSADEVVAIVRAVEVAQGALAAVLPTVHPGDRELDVAARLEAALRQRGSEWHPFPTIVASGPRAALPHARSTEREIAPGDWLLLDFGAQVDGYCADLTRTIVVGRRADSRQRDVYETVRRAQARAIGGMRAGMTGRDADALAREVIAGHGFGDAFGHSLGHGLGLEVHEAPRLAPTADEPLPAGAVVTVEPGIYLPGWGGVRLEDDVHLGPDGPVCLSDQRTELVELV
jgi:Xaa-Pro aminopeptidase